eukprot:562916_1
MWYSFYSSVMSEEENSSLVIDNGSGFMKCGFSGDDAPRAFFPSIVGRPRTGRIMIGMGHKSTYVGDEAQAKRGILINKHPIEHGIITNFNDFEQILHHSMYNELCVAPEDHDMLLTEPPLNAKANREMMIKIALETFNVPRVYIANKSVLSLYASGRTNGIVVDSGYDSTYMVPVYEGYSWPQAIQRQDFGGKDVTEYLQSLLQNKGHSLYSTAEKEMVVDMKKKLCYMAFDYENEMFEAQRDKSIERNYELPDGEILCLNEERFQCMEGIFRPSLFGLFDEIGVHEMIYDSITQCDGSLWRGLWNNIVLCGGNMNNRGMDCRLYKELKHIQTNRDNGNRYDIRIIGDQQKHLDLVYGFIRTNNRKYIYDDIYELIFKAFEDPSSNNKDNEQREYSSWLGGSILASLSTFESMWITKEEYEQEGPSVVHRKCT